MAKKRDGPENLVLPVLRELRADMRSMEGRLDARLEKIEKRLDAQTEALKGETLMARYTVLGFDDKISAIDQRMQAIEAKVR